MKAPLLLSSMLVAWAFSDATTGRAADWPQWRGPNRDGRAAGLTLPKTWPQELTQKWKTTVGPGDASPALAGGKLYVFARNEAGESLLCLDAATGKEVWRDQYEAQPATGPAGQHPGPRSSPALAAGKLVAYGVRGTLSCLDADKGKVLWRKKDVENWPRFFTASSPLLDSGLCIVQLGGEDNGGIFAYEIESGAIRWKWTEDGTAYASPVLLAVEGTRMVVTLTAKKVVGLNLADGRLLWELPFAGQGRSYNAATPVVDGQTVIFSGAGRGVRAVRVEKTGATFAARELWSNPDNGVQFSSPVQKDGRLYGLSQNGMLFCLQASDGKTLWTASLGGRGFGSLVDVGPALLALTPQAELVVFEPGDKEFKKLAGYKVGVEPYAHPVPASNGFYIKDRDSVALWSWE